MNVFAGDYAEPLSGGAAYPGIHANHKELLPIAL